MKVKDGIKFAIGFCIGQSVYGTLRKWIYNSSVVKNYRNQCQAKNIEQEKNKRSIIGFRVNKEEF